MNEPREKVRAILQSHYLHTLSRLCLLLTNQSLDDINENEQVVELNEVRELVCKLIERAFIYVHVITRWHRCVSNILPKVWLLIEETCI